MSMIDRKVFCPYCGEVRYISCEYDTWNSAEFVCKTNSKIWHAHYYGHGGKTLVHIGDLNE